MIKGVLYTTAGTRRSVVALDGRTGELIWSHSYREGNRAAIAPRQLSGRGVSYWTDGKGDERILYVTTGYRLIALNAKTGAMIPSFGEGGVVDLKKGAVFGKGQQIDLETGEIGLHSTPTVVKDVVIVGSSFKEGMTVKTHNNTKGLVRAFDVKTGKMLWTFNTIPRPGEFGNDTWENESWATNGNTGVWTQITVDEEAGLVYLPVESPTSDFYGGHRPGNNLFGESLVCVDLKTGQRKWHFQIVHHPIWDYDLSSAPILIDINVNGKAIKAVALPSKEAFLYVFDRITGQPVWPIEERPVPQSDVPGEKTSPTQPFPTKPPAYARQSVGLDDLIDFTPELNAEARRDRGALQARPDVPAAGAQQGRRAARGADDRRRRRAARTGPAAAPIRRPTSSTRTRATTRLRRSASSNRLPGSRTSAMSPAPRVSRSWSARARASAAPRMRRSAAVAAARPRVDAARSRRRRLPLADALKRPRPQPRRAWRAPGSASGRRRRRTGGAGASAPQAAVRPPERHRPGQGRAEVAGAARRYAGRGAQPPAAEGDEHPEDRAAGQRRPRRDQVARRPRRPGDHDDAGASARRDAARYDKQTGEAGGRGLDAGAAERLADELSCANGKQYIIVSISGGNYSGEYIAFSLPASETRPTNQAQR